MNWDYRADEILRVMLGPIGRLANALKGTSWYYAHYKNGNGPESFKEFIRQKPRSLWSVFLDEWYRE